MSYKKPSEMDLKELRAEFKAVSNERDALHETVVSRSKEIDGLKKSLLDSQNCRLWLARGLVIERNELQGRIARINVRLFGLGYPGASGLKEIEQA